MPSHELIAMQQTMGRIVRHPRPRRQRPTTQLYIDFRPATPGTYLIAMIGVSIVPARRSIDVTKISRPEYMGYCTLHLFAQTHQGDAQY